MAGIGWTIGVLAALEDAGALRLAAAHRVFGTSAGAATAAAVLQAGSAGNEFDKMVRKTRRNRELAPAVRLADVMPDVLAIHDTADPIEVKAGRLARLSRQRSGIDPNRRRDAIARRVATDSWPRTLSITAIRTDGRRVVFTAESGVGLVDALTASCAVPGLWPVVRINGDDYLDGGTFSLTNAELARDFDRVVVLRPTPESPAYGTAQRQAVLDRAVLVEPSARALAGFGPDPFDPDVRGVAAVLGFEDGLAAAPTIAARTQ
ncbi:patatin-like phospholipase family protein [Actinocatenispora rupis]